MAVGAFIIKRGLPMGLVAAIASTASAQTRECHVIDGVRHCDTVHRGTTVILQPRSGDYLEDYGRRRQNRKARESAEVDAMERRDCRAEARAAIDAGNYKRARALADICG